MLRIALGILALLVITSPTQASNEHAALVLHAVDSASTTCSNPGGLDCDAVRPTTSVLGMNYPRIFVLLHGYDAVQAVTAAFSVPNTWGYVFGLWECQNSSGVLDPEPPWGPSDGKLRMFVDPLIGGHLVVLGRMHFSATPAQCMEIIEASGPSGTHVVDLGSQTTPIATENRGRICAGEGGIDACSDYQPVDAATWGAIRSQYYR